MFAGIKKQVNITLSFRPSCNSSDDVTLCKQIKTSIMRDGIVDSMSNLLKTYNCDSKHLVNLLLKLY